MTTQQAGGEDWGKHAQQYKTDFSALTNKHAAEAVRLLQLGPDDRLVLDIACGVGAFALQAVRELERVRGSREGFKLLATDFAEAMVQACRQEAEAENLADVIECRQMDAQHLEGIEDGSVDVIACVFGAMFFPDVGRAFREMHRVLRPGGRAAIVVWQKVAAVDLMEQLAARLRELYPDNPTDARGLASATVYKLADPEVIKRHLTEAGMSVDGLTTHEAEWSGLALNDETISSMLNNPVTRLCYLPEQRDKAFEVTKQLVTQEGSPFLRPSWENISLIALVHKPAL